MTDPHYLLRLTTMNPIRERVQLFYGFDAAYHAAMQFVGEHNPIDGCSSPRTEFKNRMHEGFYRTSRSTSFGNRRASVQPIWTEAAAELV